MNKVSRGMPNLFELARVWVITCSSYRDSTVVPLLWEINPVWQCCCLRAEQDCTLANRVLLLDGLLNLLPINSRLDSSWVLEEVYENSKTHKLCENQISIADSNRGFGGLHPIKKGDKTAKSSKQLSKMTNQGNSLEISSILEDNKSLSTKVQLSWELESY